MGNRQSNKQHKFENDQLDTFDKVESMGDKIINKYKADKKARNIVYREDENNRRKTFAEELKKFKTESQKTFDEKEKEYLAKHRAELEKMGSMINLDDNSATKIRHDLNVTRCKRAYDIQRKERVSEFKTEYQLAKETMVDKFELEEEDIMAAIFKRGDEIRKVAFKEFKATPEWINEPFEVAAKYWRTMTTNIYI